MGYPIHTWESAARKKNSYFQIVTWYLLCLNNDKSTDDFVTKPQGSYSQVGISDSCGNAPFIYQNYSDGVHFIKNLVLRWKGRV